MFLIITIQGSINNEILLQIEEGNYNFLRLEKKTKKSCKPQRHVASLFHGPASPARPNQPPINYLIRQPSINHLNRSILSNTRGLILETCLHYNQVLENLIKLFPPFSTQSLTMRLNKLVRFVSCDIFIYLIRRSGKIS